MFLNNENQHINYERIERAIAYLQENFKRQPELDDIAAKVHMSPFHFQRIFTEWAGISPKRFLQYLTAGYLKEQLQLTRNLSEAAAAAGLSSQSRVYDLFTTLEAMTPAEYRENGSGIRINYGFHKTPFGDCLIGLTERGICWLSFLSTGREHLDALTEMKASWHQSIFFEDSERTDTIVREIFNISNQKRYRLLVKGTNFQVKVWEALLRIAPGEVTTYQQIAQRIDNPRAVQAVGSAVGMNTIAYLIPCHRVIRKDGILGEYRWNAARKKSMIGWEMARRESPNKH